MKLVLAIINRDDAKAVTTNLTKKGFSSTGSSMHWSFLSPPMSSVRSVTGRSPKAVRIFL